MAAIAALESNDETTRWHCSHGLPPLTIPSLFQKTQAIFAPNINISALGKALGGLLGFFFSQPSAAKGCSDFGILL